MMVRKRFSEFFRKHAMKIIDFKNIKMRLLIKEQQESNKNAKICYIYKEKFENKYLKDCKVINIYIYKYINIVKLEIIVIIRESIEVLRIAYVT